MYDKELERLIEVCLADGVLTDRELQAIGDKAESMGVSRLEAEVYARGRLDEILAERKGGKSVETFCCPKCGAVIPSLAMACPECGYEIRNNRTSRAVSEFSRRYAEAKYTYEKIDLLESFAVPNNKEDILEFLAMAAPLPAATPVKPVAFNIAYVLMAGMALIIVIALCSNNAGIGAAIGIFLSVLGVVGCIISYDSSDIKLQQAWDAKFKSILLKAEMLEGSDASYTANVRHIADVYQERPRLLKRQRLRLTMLYILTGLLAAATLWVIYHTVSLYGIPSVG